MRSTSKTLNNTAKIVIIPVVRLVVAFRANVEGGSFAGDGADGGGVGVHGFRIIVIGYYNYQIFCNVRRSIRGRVRSL
jgi:hypothetical protein